MAVSWNVGKEGRGRALPRPRCQGHDHVNEGWCLLSRFCPGFFSVSQPPTATPTLVSPPSHGPTAAGHLVVFHRGARFFLCPWRTEVWGVFTLEIQFPDNRRKHHEGEPATHSHPEESTARFQMDDSSGPSRTTASRGHGRPSRQRARRFRRWSGDDRLDKP